MGSNVIIGIVIAIVIIAAILYFVAYFMKKKNQDRLKAIEKRKETLFDLPVLEEIDGIKKMHLVGQSQNSFRKWNQRWVDLSTKSFADLESQIFEAESQNETFRFMKSSAAAETAEKTMLEMETEAEAIRTGLRFLHDSEARNSEQVQHALDVFEEMQKGLRDDSVSYGTALPELQKRVKTVEDEFTQFVTLNTSGDPLEAREILEKAEKHTYEVEEVMKRVPALFKDLDETFPDQIKEIEKVYTQMQEEKYVLPADTAFEDKLQHVKKRVENSLSDLEKMEIDRVEADNNITAKEIDDLYAVLEKEMASKKYVVTNRKTIGEFIEHAARNNHQLMIELDHTSQSYALNHNELGRARGFQTEIEELDRRNRQVEPQLENNELPYSEVEDYYRSSFKILDDIETQQVQIDEEVHSLRTDEQRAQEKVEEFEFRLRKMKRDVEKQRLPGLPKDYLSLFFTVTDHVEDLDKALNKIRINVDDVNQLVAMCEKDVDVLDNRTEELIDSAALSEQMMQYANRYRHNYTNVKDAIDQSLHLFNDEYRYKDALNVVGSELDRVEPGAYERIEQFYHDNKDSFY